MKANLPIASVIIPAHNEESVICRLLAALTAESAPLQIIVACNGCTDRTAEIAQGFGPPHDVHVLEIAESSKTAALRAAELLDPVFPRMYVDADVVVSGEAVVAVAKALILGPQPTGRPPLSYDTHGSSPLVTAFYRARSRTPELMSSLWGAGFYGVSEQGRARWGAFPDVGADDLFVDSLFDPAEIRVVDTESVVVRTPRRVGPLLRILQRVYDPPHRMTEAVGGAPGTAYDAPASTTAVNSLRALFRANRTALSHLAQLTVYVALSVAARLGMRISPNRTRWQRDDSSR